jgi:signal transduction histidine kinase
VGGCWAWGRTVRERRAYAARNAEQATALAVGEERLRIARELHDLVGHNVSMIAVRATVADHIADDRPQEMREALRIIASTSRDSLAELRRALAVLRIEAALAPSPTLGDLGRLADTARSAGLTVDLDVRGSGDKVPDDVGMAVFRLVQESITNVLKHAGATSCRIDVDIGAEAIRVAVTDDGSGGAGIGGRAPGQGLIGMGERIAMFDGDLAAGPKPDGGWAVEATLRYTS